MKSEEYPRPTIGNLLCQCGGKLITEETDTGNGQDTHNIYRIHCSWCQMSTSWTCTEGSCLELYLNGNPLRKGR